MRRTIIAAVAAVTALAFMPAPAYADDPRACGHMKGGNDLFIGDNDQAFQDWVWGDDGRDDMYGNPGSDDLHGGNGDDFIIGGAANDLLDGGTDDDWLEGGGGDDVFQDGRGNDNVDGGAGTDTWLRCSGDGATDSSSGIEHVLSDPSYC